LGVFGDKPGTKKLRYRAEWEASVSAFEKRVGVNSSHARLTAVRVMAMMIKRVLFKSDLG